MPFTTVPLLSGEDTLNDVSPTALHLKLFVNRFMLASYE